MSRSLTDAQAQRKAEERLKARREQQLDDWRWLLSEQRGRRLVFDLLEETGLLKSSYTGDAGLSACAEGKRMVGVAIFETIKLADVGSLSLIFKENHEVTNG